MQILVPDRGHRMRALAFSAISLLVPACQAPSSNPVDADNGTAGQASDHPVNTAGGTEVPCAVRDALVTCQSCHGETLLYGARMRLLTLADFHAPAVTDPARKVYELVAERIRDQARPMPPAGLLPDAELTALEAWLSAHAPSSDEHCADDDDGTSGDGDGTGNGDGDGTGDGDGDGAGDGDGDSTGDGDGDSTGNGDSTGDGDGDSTGDGDGDSTGVWPADCEQTHSIRAHAPGMPNQPYRVTPDQTDAYMCFHFDLPWTGVVQGLAFQSVIDAEAVVHHWLLYALDERSMPAGSVAPCLGVGQGATLLTGWAPGRDDLVMPDDVGLQMPSGSNAGLMLQIHYYANGMNVTDASGLDLCTTSTPREHNAGISWLGTTAINVQPGASGMASGTCRPNASSPIQILRTWPHMHRHGRHMSLTVNHQGGPTVLYDGAFNFDFQTSYETPFTLMPGESIVTSCRYQNTSNQQVTFGEGTDDEMCFAFVYAYPAGALRTGGMRNFCIQ